MAWISLIREFKNSVDFLYLIPNVQEHNIEIVEELNIAMYNLDQYGNTVRLESDLDIPVEDELVAELAVVNSLNGTRRVLLNWSCEFKFILFFVNCISWHFFHVL